MNKKSNILLGLVLIALAGTAFASGRLSVSKPNVQAESVSQNTSQAGVSGVPSIPATDNSATADASASSSSEQSGLFVASKTGKKYFPADCIAAKKVKDENKVTFSSAAEAEKAGYELAKNCKN